jgi:hypothetical protein
MKAEKQTPDNIFEARLAELIGSTPKALERRRQRGLTPEEVWK